MHAFGSAKQHGKRKLILTRIATGTPTGRFRFGLPDPSKVFLTVNLDFEPGRIENVFSIGYGFPVPVKSQWKKLLGSMFLHCLHWVTANRPSNPVKNPQTFTCVRIMRAYTLYTKQFSIKSLKPILLGYWDACSQPLMRQSLRPRPVNFTLGRYWDFRLHVLVVYWPKYITTHRLTYLPNL